MVCSFENSQKEKFGYKSQQNWVKKGSELNWEKTWLKQNKL